MAFLVRSKFGSSFIHRDIRKHAEKVTGRYSQVVPQDEEGTASSAASELPREHALGRLL